MLGSFIESLEPIVVSMIYKEYKNESTFFPNLGIFFNEFALIYTAVNKK